MADVDQIIESLLGSNAAGRNLYTNVWGANQSQKNALQSVLRQAFDLDEINNERFESALGFIGNEFRNANEGFEVDNARLDRVMFSGAADSAGRGAAQGLESLRNQLGARGINPASGSAASLAGGIGLRQQNQLMGAARDITADSLRRRDAQRQNRMRAAFGIADFQNQAAGMLGLDATQDVTGVIGDVQKQHIGLTEASKERSTATKAAALGGAGALLGGLL